MAELWAWLNCARDEATATRIDEEMRNFQIVPFASPELGREAARNYRILRRFGAMVRTAVDLLAGTFCIRFGHTLLHDDRDFLPMQRHLGLPAL